MAIKPSQRIRKVWLPTELKTAVYDWAWANQTKPSPVAAKIIAHIIEDPESYVGKAIPPAGKDYLSVYIPEEVWAEGTEVAAKYRTTLSGMVRVGLNDLLDTNNITWDASTPRPRNAVIPSRE